MMRGVKYGLAFLLGMFYTFCINTIIIIWNSSQETVGTFGETVSLFGGLFITAGLIVFCIQWLVDNWDKE